MPGKLKAILFDLGGTLIEYENLSWQQMSKEGFELAFEVLERSFDNLPEKEAFVGLFRRYFESRYQDSLKTLMEIRVTDLIRDCFTTRNLPGDGLLQKQFLEAYYRPITDQVAMVSGAPEVLEKLRNSGFRLGLVSNTIFPGDFHRRELQRFGLIDCFDHLLFSCEVGFKKPHPLIFKKALKALQVKPEEVIFIGDRLQEDIAGAKNIGMKAVLKLTPGRNHADDIKPDAVVNDAIELPEVIEQLALDM